MEFLSAVTEIKMIKRDELKSFNINNSLDWINKIIQNFANYLLLINIQNNEHKFDIPI